MVALTPAVVASCADSANAAPRLAPSGISAQQEAHPRRRSPKPSTGTGDGALHQAPSVARALTDANRVLDPDDVSEERGIRRQVVEAPGDHTFDAACSAGSGTRLVGLPQ